MEPLDFDVGISLTSPLPYVLVTSIDGEGRPNAMGASWITRVSFDPFLMLVSVGKKRYTHKSIIEQGEFVICYPSAEQEKGAMYCGSHSGKEGDKIARSGLEATPSAKVKPPTIKDCTVAFECKVVCQYDAGDHTLFIGEVVAVTGDTTRMKHLFVTTRTKTVAMDQKGNL
jgi:flavin reductase (DIM6/NTAB) family NADH-FMN oxidoreductase RutF